MIYLDLVLAVTLTMLVLRNRTLFVDAVGIVVTAIIFYLITYALSGLGFDITAVTLFILGGLRVVQGLLRRGLSDSSHS